MLDSFLFVMHMLSIVAVVILVLLQRDSGGLGGLAGGGNSNSLMSASSSGNAMTRATYIAATIFMVLSLVMAMRAAGDGASQSVVDAMQVEIQETIAEPKLPEPVTNPDTE